ncbi:MAG: response regulator transcription factor [Clostridia bacterium]
MIKILIVDDQEIIRESLDILLGTCDQFQVVGKAINGAQAYDMVYRCMPDVVLMDVFMPIMDGVECTKRIMAAFPKVKIIILTTFDDDQYVFDALSYGASGYLLKGISVAELESAITVVVSGGAMINPNITTKVIRLFSEMRQPGCELKVNESEIKNLTGNERLIIQQIGKGLSNREISAALLLGEGTVRNYISSILEKLGLRDRTQLAIYAVQSRQFRHKGD